MYVERKIAMWIGLLSGFGSACAGMLLFWLLGASANLLAMFAGLAYAVCAATFFFCQKNKRRMRCFGVLGAAAVWAAALSVRLGACGETGWDGLVISLLSALCLGPAAGQTFLWLRQLLKRSLRPVRPAPGRAFWLCFAVILIGWLPVVLALFPGVTGYDMQSQIYQIETGDYVNGHPIAHTLLIGLFYRLGELFWDNASAGIGLFTAFQTVCLAASMAYALSWLCLRRCPRIIWGLILAVFALAPQHAVMASSLTKDVLFAASLLALTVELCRRIMEPQRAVRRGVLIADVLLLAVTGLLRRNMILAYLLLLIALLLKARKKPEGRRLIALLLCGMVLSAGCEAGLKKSVDARNPTIHDTLAMPCQQLARVYSLYGLEHPVGYEIREKLPWAHRYAPERADAAKCAALVTGPQQLVSFLKLWAREAFHYPIEYIDAFLYTNKAYWDITDTAYAYTYDEEEYGPRGAMTVNHNPNSHIEQYDWLPRVQQLCDEWYTENGCMEILPVRLFIHPALWTWVLLFGYAWAVYERRRAETMAWALPGIYLCTLLLGPCALIRYCYCVMLAAPVLLGAVCTPAKEEERDE